MRLALSSLLVASAVLVGPGASVSRAAPPKLPPYGLPALERPDFNRLAASAGLPIFWKVDADKPGELEPGELTVLGANKLSKFVAKDGLTFTRDFEKAYRQLVELRRREAVQRELAQGRPTLVETDLTALSEEERAVIKSLAKAGEQIDTLYQLQTGAAALAAKVPRDDVASQALFRRNQGPWCEAPMTQQDPFCSAVPGFQQRVVTVWPVEEVPDAAFCAKMAAEPNAKDLTAPFTVVRKKKDGSYDAIPYTKAYGAPMKAVAKTLRATAKLIKSADEKPFVDYLLATAKAFENNDWESADEAWSKMSAENSRWYLRISPDETYWDPCQLKSGFMFSFARVDREALAWKQKLSALRSELEQSLAALIGAPYVARQVSFELPEFIEIVLNGGDSRGGLGATVGQSLPNFGKVAEESRGRTVAMANLYTDADSLADFAARDRLLWGPDTLARSTEDPAVEQLGTVLHEATHNLGPNGAWKVDGKAPQEVFGGQVDAILEELKSQTGALFYLRLLRDKGLIDAKTVEQSIVGSLSWAFGHVAQGMTDGSGHPKTYSQLSAIQVGELMRAGAMRWIDGTGPDAGRFELDFTKIEAAIDALMKEVGRIKAAGDVAGAKALIERNVSAEGLALIKADIIRERVLRFPKASFVYGFRGE